MALNLDGFASMAEFSSYLSSLTDAQVSTVMDKYSAAFKSIDRDNPGNDDVERASGYGEKINATRDELKRRQHAAASKAADAAAKASREALANLDRLVMGEPSGTVVATADQPGSVLMQAIADGVGKAMTTVIDRVGTVTASGSSLNQHIRDMPLSRLKSQNPGDAAPRSEAVIVASTDIPGHAKSSKINGISELTQLMGSRARMLPVTRGNPNYVNVATMQREHKFRLSLDSTPEEINTVLTAATDINALVAAGGWCAPSEISYDFFNLVCEDGMIDLPSVGILNRGGFRFPVSPSIADIFSESSGAIWSWTEQQDIDALVSDSDVKTCAHVPCVDFNEVRASCDGLCVTAGNLTDFAYPELVENFIRLVMAARAHATNQAIIEQLVGLSTAVPITTDEGATSAILSTLELQAFDYRERYRMCEGAILEAVFPRWVYGVIRADVANRNGVNLLGVTDAMIADWFDIRGIRAQFVADWQSGVTGSPIGAPTVNATSWPDSVTFLLYAPGTFVRGQGLQLDLGVVRDSTLNATNDFTAAWMEDCYAVAMVGHESRAVTITGLCTAGVTGANALVCDDGA